MLEQCFDGLGFAVQTFGCGEGRWQGQESGKTGEFRRERREDEKAAPGEELWNEMPQEVNFGEFVPWKGGVTIFFGCPGKHL